MSCMYVKQLYIKLLKICLKFKYCKKPIRKTNNALTFKFDNGSIHSNH